ncbi:MAG TPA: FtsX-like permease family protein [Actinocrinis sp.]|uniref:FtsX-like permease family protein n=1 Tax=Actinocrinis sp. TaxID=1920516 RepID=UPI002DDC9BB0|nr:FtsX-like permease family protein [Actinocrinis sp.]HEV3171287.1 FtsX-like permease family protein [Actinocrinis sp.]
MSIGGGTTGGLTARRARVQARVVFAAFFLALGATVALAAVAAFASDAATRAVAQIGQRATPEQRRLVVTYTVAGSEAAIRSAAAADISQNFTALPSRLVTGVQAPALATSAGGDTPVLWTSPQLGQSASLTAGTWPDADDSPGSADAVPVAVSTTEASHYRLTVGSLIPLGAATVSPRAGSVAVVTGIYRPASAADPLWTIPESTGVGTEPLYAAPAAFDQHRVSSAVSYIVVGLDYSRLSEAGLDTVRAQLARLSDVLANDPSITAAPGQASADAQALLDQTSRALVVARPAIAVPILEAVAVACCAIAVTARLLARGRRPEAALMRSRGASVWHLLRYDLIETLAITVPAAALAPWIGARLAALTAGGGDGAGVWSLPDAAVWIAAAAGGLVFTGLLVLVGGVAAREDSVARAGRIPPGVAAAGIDLAALALAAAGVWELRRGVSAQAATGTLDPVTVCAPTLAVLAFALVSTRLVSLAGRIAQRIAGRRRGWPGAFGSWHAARLMRTHTAAVVLIATATALVVLSGADRAATDRSAVDQADFAVGADVRATGLGVDQVRSGGLAETLPGIAAVARVQRISASIGRSGTGGQATLLATDPARWEQVARIRSDLTPAGASALLAPLTAHSTAPPGLPLPGRPSRLRLTVRLTGPYPIGARLDLSVAGVSGGGATLDAPLASTGAAQPVAIDLTPAIGDGSTVAWPLRVTRIGVLMTAPASDPGALGFDVLSLSTDAGPVAAAAGQSWKPTADLTAPTSDPNVLAELNPAHAATAVGVGAAGGASVLLHGTFDPGSIPAGVATQGQSAYSAVLALPAPAAVPAVVTAGFLAAAGSPGPGATVEVAVGANVVPLLIVSTAKALPTTQPSDNAVLIDQNTLNAYAAGHDFALSGDTELWARAQPGAAAKASAALISSGEALEVQDRFSAAAQLMDDPVRDGPVGALTIAAFAAVLFALFGYGAHVAAIVRERIAQLAAVRALGFGAADIGLAFGVEQALVAVVGVVAGAAAGLGLSQLIVPSVVLARDGSAPQPSVLVGPDWTAVGLSGAAVLAVVAAVICWIAFRVPRLRVAALLRTGGAG